MQLSAQLKLRVSGESKNKQKNMAQQGVEYGRKRASRAGAQLAGLSDQISSGHLPSTFDVRVDTVFEVDRTCLTSGAVMSMGVSGHGRMWR